MKKCCFFVAFAILLSVIAPAIPAYAASEPINVMLGADCIRTVNVNTDRYSASSYGGVSDPSKMTDERYGVGPTNKDEGFNSSTIDKWRFYDADGNEDLYYGDYLWSVTFDLNGAYTIDTLSLMTMDLTPFIGDTDPVQWLQRGFDILVSDTGLAGSWKIAHRAEELHTEDDPGEYTYHAPTDDFPMGYYQYDATFEAVTARYIQLACTDYTSYTMEQSHWINISELEIYTAGDTPSVPSVPEKPGNVMRNATFVRGKNFREDIYVASQYGGVCGPEKVTDGRYGVGPSQVDDGFNSKLIDLWKFYDLEGNQTENGGYMWYMIFQLDDLYTVDRFSLITDDLTTCCIGNTNPVQWLQLGFKILVSESGEPDSWEAVYTNWNAHTETDKGDYQYFAPTEERPLGYYQLDATFSPAKARYICFAAMEMTSYETNYGHWINISELEVYTAGGSATELPAENLNVMGTASYTGQFNLNEEFYSESRFGGVSDPTKLIDGFYSEGVSNADDGLNTKVIDKTATYNADGQLTAGGEYLWGVTYQLKRAYELDGFSLIIGDLSNMGIGISNTVPWLQMGFDILVSESGEDGSWQVVHQARDLHTETSHGKYTYVPEDLSQHMGYYFYTDSFTPIKANYVRFASTSLTCPNFEKSHWINISELQVYGKAADITLDPTPVPPEPGNVMRNASYVGSVNVREDVYLPSGYGGVCGPDKLMDGRYGVGPTQLDDSLNTKVIDQLIFHDADGNEDDNGEYLWFMTFQLDKEYTLNSFSLMTDDLTTCGIGSTNPVQWLQLGFDILVSDTGEDGSWSVAYSVRNLHTDSNRGRYEYVDPTAEKSLGYYVFSDVFAPVKARYIRFASTDRTSYTITNGHWINIAELQVFDDTVEVELPVIPETPTEPLPLPSGENVMKNAFWTNAVNLSESKYGENSDGTLSDPSKMIDGVWGVGPTQKEEGLNTRIDQLWTYYNADGYEDDEGSYMWTATFKLDRKHSLNGLRMITMDMSEEIGDTATIQWLQRDFDILVSDTGMPGSWQVVYSARNLHSENNPGAYRYQEATDDKLAYYELIAEFPASANAQYIKFASLSHTSDVIYYAHWINIGELEIYGDELPAAIVDSGECSETISWELNEFGVLHIYGTGDMPDWEYSKAPWNKHTGLTTIVIIDEGITGIGNYAFNGFQMLMHVSIPSGVTRIGAHAFSTCTNLKAVQLPNTLRELGEDAFSHNYRLTEVAIPGSVSVIPENAFYYSYSLNSVTIGEGVTHIGQRAFGNCDGLTEIHIPKSVTQIAERAFEGCRNMLAFTVDSENGFYMADETGVLFTKDGKTLLQFPCGKQMDAYTVPNTVTSIAASAFSECRLKELTISAGVTKIGGSAFFSSNIVRITVLNDSVDLTGTLIPYNATIRGYAGSSAEDYAGSNHHTFEAISRGGVDGQIRIYHPRTTVHVRLLRGETEVYTATITPTAGSETVSFSFRDVSAGTYDVQIDGDGLLPYTIRGIVVADAVVDLTAHENEAISTITPAAGDIDGNGFIDLADVVLLTSESTYGLSYEEARTKAADVNGDGIFDLQDLAIVTSEIGYGRSAVLVDFH